MAKDLIIIGGGAAGMMAAITAKKTNPALKVTILDRTFALGRKILVCGAGRCNVTNLNLDKSVADHYYGAESDFISEIFKQFGYKDITAFFDDLGIPLYVERKSEIGKLFPITDQAKTVTALLEDELIRLNIAVQLNTEVAKVEKRGERFVLELWPVAKSGQRENFGKEEISSDLLVLSAGGKTYPALGSNGSGYALAEKLGHRIITAVPSALPLEASSSLIHELQGVKLDAEVTSIIGGQVVKTRTDEVLFTTYGISGPAILNISREVSIRLNRDQRQDVVVRLNLLPGQNFEQVRETLEARWQKRPTQYVEKSLYGLLPNKVATAILKVAGIPNNKKVNDLNAADQKKLITTLQSHEIIIKATRGWNEAEFTAGGVDTKQVKTGTLESKLVPGLYLCGEILNVDGDVGGFNLSWAWSSGHVAGKLL